MIVWQRFIVLLTALLMGFAGGCTPPTKTTVLISMLGAQEEYFKNEVAPGFTDRRKVELDVVHYGSVDSISSELSKYKGQVALVKVPFDKSWSLVRENMIRPLNDFLDIGSLNDFNNTYLLTSLGQKDGEQYYIPRKFETRIMVYRKSKVADALATWRNFKPEIDAELKKYNGYGLPATYLMEDNVSLWNYFDVFVAGWVWAHTPYDGKSVPRVAHRGKRYSGTALRMIDRVFQCGGDSAAIVSMTDDAVVDAYEWEAAYANSGVFNSRMWTEAWSGSGVWQGFSENEVFLSFMTQLDCFFIHGTGRDGLNGYLADPDDMGVATMPAGCSLQLDGKGNTAREGIKSITTGGWWWGIPRNAPDPNLSYQLARHITNTENQVQGCSRFGMIPVRKDILSDMSMLFGGGWVTEIYDVSFRQLMENKRTTLPGHAKFDQIRDIYLDAWFDIVVGKNWSADKTIPDRRFIRSVLASNYAQKIADLH